MLPSSKSQQESTRRLQNLCDKFRATKRVIGKSPLSPSQNHGAGMSPRKRDAKGLLQPQWELLPEQLGARLPLPRLAPGAITPSHQNPGQSYLIPSLRKGACQPAPPQCGLQLSTPCPHPLQGCMVEGWRVRQRREEGSCLCAARCHPWLRQGSWPTPAPKD